MRQNVLLPIHDYHVRGLIGLMFVITTCVLALLTVFAGAEAIDDPVREAIYLTPDRHMFPLGVALVMSIIYLELAARGEKRAIEGRRSMRV